MFRNFIMVVVNNVKLSKCGTAAAKPSGLIRDVMAFLQSVEERVFCQNNGGYHRRCRPTRSAADAASIKISRMQTSLTLASAQWQLMRARGMSFKENTKMFPHMDKVLNELWRRLMGYAEGIERKWQKHQQMSTWKKISAATRRKHHERGQHADRMHLGLLEKHSDYKLRADNYNQKQQVLQNLRKRALNRNPDEFYFGMIRTRNRGGVHELKNKIKDYTDDELKLIRDNDKKYVEFRLQLEKKKLERLMSAANSVKFTGKIVRFYDSDEEINIDGDKNDFCKTEPNDEIRKRQKRMESLNKVAETLRNPKAYVDILKEAK